MEDFGSRSSSLVPYQTTSPAAIPSKELSDVIVNAFSVAADQFTQNIQNNTTNNISGNLTGGVADTSIAEYYKNLLRQSLEKEEKEKKKALEEKQKKEEQLREKEWQEYQKNAQTVINTMSNWANNPLQGVSDIIDAGFKKVFASVETVWNMPLKEVGPNIKKAAGTIFRPITATAEVAGKALTGFGGALGGLKQVLSGGAIKQSEELDMDSLIQAENEDENSLTTANQQLSKSEKDEEKQLALQKNKDDKENSEKEVAATQGVGLTVGGLFTQYILPIVLAVVAGAALLPIIVTKITEGFLTLKNISFPMFIENIRMFFENAGIDIEARFKELFSNIPLFGYDPGKEVDKKFEVEQARMLELEKNSSGQERKAIKEYRKRAEGLYALKSSGANAYEIALQEKELREAAAKIQNKEKLQKLQTSMEEMANLGEQRKNMSDNVSIEIERQKEEKKKAAAEASQQRRMNTLYEVGQKNYTMNLLSKEQMGKYLDTEHQAQLIQKMETEGKSQQELLAANGKTEDKILKGREYMDSLGKFGNDIKINVVGTGFKNPVGAQ